MQKIRDYIAHFFKYKEENRNYSLTTDDMVAFFDEIQYADSNSLFHVIALLFRYGYVKGYRACKVEQEHETIRSRIARGKTGINLIKKS